MRVKIKAKDGVWQPCLIKDENLYKLRMKHGEDRVVIITGQERATESQEMMCNDF